jgi:ABC-2 type transport system ATP-binding protein
MLPTGSPAVEVRELIMRYGRTTAVDGVSFEGVAGQVIAVLGPNGAGKTTTIETLEGYRSPTAGAVRVLGLDPRADVRALAPRIGVMLQRDGVSLTMGPRDVLRLFAAYYGRRARCADEVLGRLGLSSVASTPFRRLSGGEQQRLKLAMAIIGRPEVAFLDEPTAAVDAEARRTVRAIVDDLRAEGCCVIVSTHELDEAERIADRILIMDRGRIVADGSADELRRAAAGPTDVLRFRAAPGLDTHDLSVVVGAPAVEAARGEYEVRAEPTPAVVATLTSWLAHHDIALGDLRAGRATLEDVFLRLTAAEAGGSVQPAATDGGRTQRRSRRSRR